MLDGGGKDGGERMVVVRVLQTQRREERLKRGVLYSQQCPYFNVEKSKLPMVSVLCHNKCV